MFCPKCGKELVDTAKFCSSCGGKIDSATSVIPEAPVSSVIPETPVSVAVDEAAENVSENTAAMKSIFSENTIPMNTAENNVSETASAAPVTTVENASAGNNVKAKGFKFTKKTAIGIGAAVVGVAAVGVGVSAFTFAKADFSHAFMGNKRYSAYVLSQQYSSQSTLVSAMPSNISSDTDEGNYATIVAAALKEVIPEQGVEIEVSGNLNLKNEQLEDFADYIGCDTQQAEELLKAIENCSAKLGVKFTDDGIVGSGSFNEGGSELAKVVVYYDAESEAYYFTTPGVPDESIMLASDEMIIDMESINTDSKEDNEVSQMVTDVINAYKDSLDDAEITYEKGTFSIGDVEFKGRINTVTFEGDALIDMVENVGGEFADSDFAELYSLDFDVDDLIDDIEYYKSAKLVIRNFINGDNTGAGMNIEITVKTENGKKNTAQIGYLNCKDGLAYIYDISDSSSFVLSQDMETKNSGKYTIKYNDGYDDRKFTVSYENARTKKIFGKEIQLGEYSMKIPDSSDKISVVLSDDDNKFNCTVTAKVDEGTYSATIKIAEGFSESIDKSIVNNAVDAEDDAMNELEVELIQNFAEKAKDSELCNAIPYDGGSLSDYFADAAEKAQREVELKRNYSEYDESTARLARNMANQIYLVARSSGLTSKSQNETKIKLFFDGSGSVSVIDDGGVAEAADLAQELNSNSFKKSYAEIVLWKGRGPVLGVNVVMTDDKNNVPDNLPNAYNFLDRAYNWGSNDDVNFVGSFVVGAYPTLSNEESGATQEKDNKAVAAIKTYSDEAKKAADALSEYTGLTYGDGNNLLNFIVSDSKWTLNRSVGSTINGSKTDLEAYMTSTVGTVTAKYVCVYIKNGIVTGAMASNGNVYSNFAVEDFESGCTEKWTYLNGVISNGYTVGTYPTLESMTQLPKNLVNSMIGTWTSRSGESITVTNEIIDECTSFVISRSSGSVYSITIALGDNGSFTYYRSQTKPYISYNYISYYKN